MTFYYSLLVVEVPRGIFPLMPSSFHAKMDPISSYTGHTLASFYFLCLSSVICLSSFFWSTLVFPAHLFDWISNLSQSVWVENDLFSKHKPSSLPSPNLHDTSLTKPTLYLSGWKKCIKITDYTSNQGKMASGFEIYAALGKTYFMIFT